MKKHLFLLVLATFCAFSGFAQSETQLLKLKEPVEGFSRQGPLSTYRSGPSLGMTPRIAMVQTEEGILLKADNMLYRFGLDWKKQWEVALPKTLRLFDMPVMEMVADAEMTYFVEEKTNPSKNKFSVVQINAQGKLAQAEYEVDLNTEDLFVLQGNLHLLSKDPDKKSNSIAYTLHVIDKQSRKLTSKKVNLPASEYEYKRAKSGLASEYYWHQIGKRESRIILAKSYFRDVEGQKKSKQLVIDLIEMGPDGSLSNAKDLIFEPALAGEDRRFFAPTLLYNAKEQSVTLAGFMEIDKNKINGLYLLKYDYATSALTYKHEHPFNQILKPEIKPGLKAHYQIPEMVNDYYPLKIRKTDLQYDYINGFLNLRIITDFDLKSYSFFEVRFDQYGDHIQTSFSDYWQAIHLFGTVIPTPTKYQLLWKDTTLPHVVNSKAGAWGYIGTQAKWEARESVYWLPMAYPQSNTLIRFDQDRGVFSVIEIK